MLTSKQKKYLKYLAHDLSPMFQVGKDGVSTEMIEGINQAIERHELLKIKVLNNCDDPLKQIALDLSAGTRSDIVQIIGHVIVIYKRSKNHPRIDLSEAR